MIYALIIFDIACGIPCEMLEEPAGPYTFEECRDQRQATLTRYILEENRRVWVVCVKEE